MSDLIGSDLYDKFIKLYILHQAPTTNGPLQTLSSALSLLQIGKLRMSNRVSRRWDAVTRSQESRKSRKRGPAFTSGYLIRHRDERQVRSQRRMSKIEAWQTLGCGNDVKGVPKSLHGVYQEPDHLQSLETWLESIECLKTYASVIAETRLGWELPSSHSRERPLSPNDRWESGDIVAANVRHLLGPSLVTKPAELQWYLIGWGCTMALVIQRCLSTWTPRKSVRAPLFDGPLQQGREIASAECCRRAFCRCGACSHETSLSLGIVVHKSPQ